MASNDLAMKMAKEWYADGLTGELSEEDEMRARGLARRFREYGNKVAKEKFEEIMSIAMLTVFDDTADIAMDAIALQMGVYPDE